jgi:tripartite motif-containing protein 2/3/tripartite motif-containing protein 71
MDKISCPMCRHETILKSDCGGVAGLKSAFHVVNLLEIERGLSKVTAESEMTYMKDAQSSCLHHGDEETSLFCETCQVFICLRCTIVEHHGHQYDIIDAVTEKSKQELLDLLKPAEMESANLEESLIKFQKRAEAVSSQEAEIESQINEMTADILSAVERKKSELITKLRESTRSKLHAVDREKAELVILHSRLRGCVHHVRQLATSSVAAEIILDKEGSKKLINLVLSESKDVSRDPHERANMMITTAVDATIQSIDVLAEIKEYPENPEKCYAIAATGLSEATMGETHTATVYVVNDSGLPCKPGNKIEFHMTSAVNGNQVSGYGTKRKEDQYEISYQPPSKGINHLSIVINREHVIGSPFKVSVRSTVKDLGPILGSFCSLYPCGIALDKDRDMVVVSDREDGISLLHQDGELFQTISSSSFTDVALGNDQSLYVVDAANNRVMKFSPQGIVTCPQLLGESQLDFNNPLGIAFNHKNYRVYVTDSYNHQIKVLSTNLTLHKAFGKNGSLKGEFKYPWGISCDGSGKVYVADSENDRIQIFSAEGRFIRMLGKSGEKPGELRWPLGITVDSATNLVYIGESGNHRVSVFGANGQFIRCFGEVRSPRGVAIDRNTGVVYVCDYDNSNILVY